MIKILAIFHPDEQPIFEQIKQDHPEWGVGDCADLKKYADRNQHDKFLSEMEWRAKQADFVFVILGANTKRRAKYIKWQIDAIADGEKYSLIVINPNGIRSVDYDRCPRKLHNRLSLHVANHPEILKYATEVWPKQRDDVLEIAQTKVTYAKRTYRLTQDVYEQFGLDTANLDA